MGKQYYPSTAVECCQDWQINHRGVVVDGCKAACGCAILTTLANAGVAE